MPSSDMRFSLVPVLPAPLGVAGILKLQLGELNSLRRGLTMKQSMHLDLIVKSKTPG